MYFRTVRTPTEREVRLIDYASRVAGVAIERHRSQAALQQAFVGH
jgi:GAF domain-containing protein